MLNSRYRVLLLFCAAISVSAMACCCYRWPRTDEFVEGLHCGMSEDALRRYAQDFKGTEVHSPDRPGLPDLVVEHGVTVISCWFDEGKLETVEVAWIRRPMKMTIESVRDLCKDESSADSGSYRFELSPAQFPLCLVI